MFLCNNSLSGLAHNAEDARDRARLVPNRGIGDVEVHVLWVTVPLDVEGAVLGVSVVECFATVCGVGLLEAPAHPLG